MAWIEVHESLRNHYKVARLAECLNQPYYACVGTVVGLWLWALENAPEGDLSPFSAKVLALACNWQSRNGNRLVEALIESGFLDEDMHIHEWEKYAGRLIKQRERHRARNRLRADCAKSARIPKPRNNSGGMNEYASTGTLSAGGADQRRHMTQREKAMLQVCLSEMEHLAGEAAVPPFEKLLLENHFSEDQITMALEYAERKKNRGEITQPLGYVHQLLLDWEAAGVREKEEIIRHLSGE